MTPAARLQAAIEVLDQLALNAAPADGALKAWGRNNRYAGSGDRRAVTDQVYLCLRERGRLIQAMGAKDGRALVLGALRLIDRRGLAEIEALFAGAGYGPKVLTDKERDRLHRLEAPEGLGLPPFVEQQLALTFGEAWPAEAEALLKGRAPLDIRVNAAKATVDEVRAAIPVVSIATPLSAWGLRLESAADLAAMDTFVRGWFEVQDEGSQIAAFLAGSAPGALIVDYCAGGGGKALALLASARDDGGGATELIACDTDQRRLDAVRARLARVGLKAQLRLLGAAGEGTDDLAGRADLVLVDAPCSGSGTWRRKPEAAWRTDETQVAAFADLQGRILARAAALARPGGRLAYVTCSVLAAENGAVAEAFAASHADFRPLPIHEAARTPNLTDAARTRLAALSGGGHTVQLSPLRAGTDGFFVALFERTA